MNTRPDLLRVLDDDCSQGKFESAQSWERAKFYI